MDQAARDEDAGHEGSLGVSEGLGWRSRSVGRLGPGGSRGRSEGSDEKSSSGTITWGRAAIQLGLIPILAARRSLCPMGYLHSGPERTENAKSEISILPGCLADPVSGGQGRAALGLAHLGSCP